MKPLIEYRDFDYWIYDDHRNPFQLVAHLSDAIKYLKPKDPDHLSLFFDLAWLYLVTLIKVTEHVRGAFLSNPDRGLQEYLYGGPTGLREKKQVADLLQSLRPDGAKERDHLPEYFGNLRELTTRLMRRPNHMQNALRQAEASSALAAARQKTTMAQAFGDEYDDIAAKLVADVCGFLVSAAGIDPEFRVLARAYLLGESVVDAKSEAEADGKAKTPTSKRTSAKKATATPEKATNPGAHGDTPTLEI